MNFRHVGGWMVMGALVGCGAAPPPEGALVVEATPAAAAMPAEPPLEVAATPAAEEPAAAEASQPAAPAVAAAPEPPPAPPPAATPELADEPGAPELDAAAASMRAKKWVQARKQLDAALKALGPAGRVDAVLVGRALLGQACAELKDLKCAAKEYQEVAARYRAPATRQELDALGGDEAAKLGRTRRSLEAAGEALFFLAEQKRAEADKVRMPEYQGDGSSDSVKRFVTTKVADFVKKKRAAIEDSEKAYQQILGLQPVPPPRWVIAAAARVGVMQGRFAAEFRAAPIPNDWKKNGTVPGSKVTYKEIREAYYATLDEASAPIVAQARAAFQVCKDMAQKYGIQDEHAAHCATWLEKSPR